MLGGCHTNAGLYSIQERLQHRQTQPVGECVNVVKASQTFLHKLRKSIVSGCGLAQWYYRTDLVYVVCSFMIEAGSNVACNEALEHPNDHGLREQVSNGNNQMVDAIQNTPIY